MTAKTIFCILKNMTDPVLALLVFALLAAAAVGLFWPAGGLVDRIRRFTDLDERVRLEDAIKHIYRCQRARQRCSLDSLAGRLGVSRARAATLISRLAELRLVRTPASGPALTADGERSAVQIVRTHRMWERYLADRTGVPAGEWHAEAERMEHSLSAAQVDALDARLGHPVWDPHGDPIPTPAGEMPPEPGFGLPGAEPGRTVEVLHLEDEPREIYDALLESGLSLGARLEILERTDRTIRLRSHGRTRDLDPVTADNVTVRYLAEDEAADTTPTTLLDAPAGRTVRVASISRACQGAQRRRLLDLGLVPGTAVTPELTSAAGDPVAYRIRGALIALRRTQAGLIWIEPPDGAAAQEAV